MSAGLLSWKSFSFKASQSPSVSIVHPTSWGQHNKKKQHLMKTNLPWQFFVTFLGWLSDPLERLSDLQLGDEKVTLKHLVQIKTLDYFTQKFHPQKKHGRLHPDLLIQKMFCLLPKVLSEANSRGGCACQQVGRSTGQSHRIHGKKNPPTFHGKSWLVNRDPYP